MLARTLGVFALCATLAGAAPAPSTGPVHYTLAPVMNGGALAALAVEIRFAGDGDGETRIELPVQWAGTDSLWRQLDSIAVQGAASVREDGPAARIVTHAPGAALAVRYRVLSAYAEEPGFEYHKALPLVLAGWFFVHGEGVFATPEGREASPARFAWSGVPAGWTVASDLDHIAAGQPATVMDVVESVAMGAPDLVVMRHDMGGATLRVATRGSWRFAPQAFAGMVQRIVRAEDRLWGAPSRDFFVPLAPLGGPATGHAIDGTGRSDAFSIASTSGLELPAITRLLAHEYMHTWLPAELGGHLGQDGALGFWFTEGFTDFYAARVLLRSGLWTLDEYVAELNTVLMRYGASPARTATAAQVMEGFWSDPNLSQLPYDRGHLIALGVDRRIRQASGGRMDLDDLVLAQRAAARRNGTGAGRVPAAVLFPRLLQAQAGIDLAPELARHEDRGEPVLLPADLYGACAEVRTLTQPEFQRGFDHVATTRAGNVITGVDPASPAYAAGLRDGMRLLRRDAGVVGDATVALVYVVDDGGTERVIRYLPEGKGRITFQRVTLRPGASATRCAALMSGV